MKKYYKKAFTLIELSIVVVVVSLIIGGIAKSGNFALQKFRLASARSLTRASVVASIPDLKLWAETSLENSVVLTNNETITSTWYDINPQEKNKKNLTSQSALTSLTTAYNKFAINDLPALYFNSDNYFSISNPQFLTDKNYTIFMVDCPTAGAYGGDSAANLLGDNTASSNINLIYNNQNLSNSYYNKIRAFAFSGSSNLEFNNNFAFGVSNIHTLKFNKSDNNYYYWLNGGASIDASGTRGTIDTTNCKPCANKQTVGGYGYRGYIAELIIFTRNLTDQERQDVETYLSKKYSIAIR